jgi:N-acetylglucosaminyldiphosphoundecaprenol N-acetyl-beta-D-mannosaminyltransferase
MIEEGLQYCSLRCGQLLLSSVSAELIFLRSRPFTQVVTVNAELFVLAHNNEVLRHITSTSVNTIDGRVLQLICRLIYPGSEIRRVVGADLIYELASHCQKNRQKVFLLGSTQKANKCAIGALQKQFPGIQVSGFAPPWRADQLDHSRNECILEVIQDARPEHLVVCFGPMVQETWIHRNSARLQELGVRCAYGLGGTIDVVAGLRRRAPRWVQFIGAEWLFRLICDPRGRFSRTLRMFKMPLYAALTKREIHAQFGGELLPSLPGQGRDRGNQDGSGVGRIVDGASS